MKLPQIKCKFFSSIVHPRRPCNILGTAANSTKCSQETCSTNTEYNKLIATGVWEIDLIMFTEWTRGYWKKDVYRTGDLFFRFMRIYSNFLLGFRLLCRTANKRDVFERILPTNLNVRREIFSMAFSFEVVCCSE